MVEEILPEWYRIDIPLPGSPLKSLNAYVIRGVDRTVIVDTGLNRSECLKAMEAGLTELRVDLGQTDFFITHLHADHFGLVAKLLRPGRKVYFNRPDAEIIESWSGWEFMVRYAGRNGFPEDKLRAALDSHPGYRFSSDWVPELSLLDDEDTLAVGRYRFRCVSTPGHTRGHICLYEPTEKILLAGDHLLLDITPNIQCWSDGDDPLHDYLLSLSKVTSLDIDRVLPGHRRSFGNPRERIAELREHHHRRAEEVLAILAGGGPAHAFQVASQMHWDIVCPSWDAFPLAQQWFATGEAIAHLRFLEAEKRIRRTEGPVVTFSL